MSGSLAAGTTIRGPHPAGAAAVVRRELSALPQSRVTIAFALVGFAALTATLTMVDVPIALAGMLLVAGGIALLLMPQVATLLMVFLLYSNIPAVASRYHGVPRMVAGSFILLLAIPLAHRTIVRGERLRTDRTITGMVVFLGVLLLASLRAKGIDLAFQRILTFAIEGLLLYWLVLNTVRDLAMLRRVLWVVLTAGGFLGALTVYQEATGAYDQQFGGLANRNYESIVALNALRADPEDPATRAQLADVLRQQGGERSKRAEGPMDEPNRFAQVLVVLLPIAAFMYRTSRLRAARLAALLGGALMLGAIVFSSSRGGLIAVGLLALIALYVRWVKPLPLLVALLVLVPTLASVAPRAFERMAKITGVVSLFRGESAHDVDGAIRGRVTEMLAAYQVFLDHPVLGVGPAQYPTHYSRAYHQKNPRLAFRQIEGSRRAHSLYFELAAELGIVGVLSFFAIVGLLMRDLARMRHAWMGHRQLADLATAFLLSLTAYFVTAVFLHMAYERYFWFLMALAGVALVTARQARAASSAAAAAPRVAA